MLGQMSLFEEYDSSEEDLLMALHQSMCSSDPDAAVYWMCRMLDKGDDPLYIARRLVRFASEEVGMADSGALPMALAAYQACQVLGLPECDVHLTHAVVYLSMSPKSNALYRACESCKKDISVLPAEPIPQQIREIRDLELENRHYGEGYLYASMHCLPDALTGRRYYEPTDQGKEKEVKESLEKILEWKNS